MNTSSVVMCIYPHGSHIFYDCARKFYFPFLSVTGGTVAVLILVKSILLLFVRKNHKVIPAHFLTLPHSLFHIFLMARSAYKLLYAE